jgi:hypothetical protein
MCPHCGQNAPVVYRGVAAYCSACGKARIPLTANNLHMAGQPSRVGSIVARTLGWIVLGVGLSFALGIAAIAHLLFPAGYVGLAIGAPLAIISVVLGMLLLGGGKKLHENGASAEKRARTQAIFALASNKGGTLTALDVAAGLDLPAPVAESFLQALAKEEYEKVAVDVDASGTLVYRFSVPTRVRVDGTPVDPEIARSPNRAEWERLEAEEAERRAAGGVGTSSQASGRARAGR